MPLAQPQPNNMVDLRKNTTASLGVRNNNPGNLRDSGIDWQGRVGSNKGFTTFSSVEYGIRALAKDLTSKNKRGLDTLAKYIPVYAPPSENNTNAYLQYMVNATGFQPNQKLSINADTLFKLVKAHIGIENGNSASLIPTDSIRQGVLMSLAATPIPILGNIPTKGALPIVLIGVILASITILIIYR